MAKSVVSDLDFGGVARLQNLPAPATPNEPARLIDLNAAVEGVTWKDNVRVASPANVNLAAPGAMLDGVNLVANDRVLLANQTAPAQNGIYIWNGATVPMTRAPDASTAKELEGAIVPVDAGTSAGAGFRQTSVAFVLDTDPVVWTSWLPGAPAASTSVPGVIAIATQPETDAGAVNNKVITPQTLAGWVNRKLKASATIGDGSATAFTITHNFNTRDVEVSVYRNSGNFDDVMVDVYRPSLNSVQIVFGAAPALNAYNVVIVA